MVVLCTPLHDTWSTTYSLPWRNSCTSTAAPWTPTLCCAVMRSLKCSSTSSLEWQSLTPSEPADSTGLTTTGIGSLSTKALTSTHLVPPAWRTERKPRAFTSSCWTFLSRLCGTAVPFVRSPSSSERKSASVTPDSPPTMHATSSSSPTASLNAAAVSFTVCCSRTSATYFTFLQLSGTWALKSSLMSFVHTAASAYPREATSAATLAPVEIGSTTATQCTAISWRLPGPSF
mmetsp:Transcript_23228/g.64895  ORF Transcript_23228/g.64895 Transcript_23228/m.64895 type:complete len:232 (-) Transcript_23228:86-781(-)